MGFMVFGFLLLSFQNCGQNLATIKESSSSTSGQNNEPKKNVPSSDQKTVYDQLNLIEIPESPYLDDGLSQAMQASLKSADNLFTSKKVFIDHRTGQIKIVDQNEVEIQGAQFCLKEDDMSELQAILTSAEICQEQEAQANQQSDVICAQEFKYPYAKLHLDRDVVSVGESFSSCHKGPDLCGEYSGLLKNFLSYVVLNLNNMRCEFTPL